MHQPMRISPIGPAFRPVDPCAPQVAGWEAACLRLVLIVDNQCNAQLLSRERPTGSRVDWDH